MVIWKCFSKLISCMMVLNVKACSSTEDAMPGLAR
jgi:hypothetical protein